MPPMTGVLETALYVEDVPRSLSFYERVCGLTRMVADDRFAALNVAGRDVLLLFRKGGSTQPQTTAGGVIPPHDGWGETHFAFAVPADALAAWEQHLKETGVEVESRVVWPAGGTSLYFRDPDRNLVEIATPGVWPIY